jgi:hypothetical protein
MGEVIVHIISFYFLLLQAPENKPDMFLLGAREFNRQRADLTLHKHGCGGAHAGS